MEPSVSSISDSLRYETKKLGGGSKLTRGQAAAEAGGNLDGIGTSDQAFGGASVGGILLGVWVWAEVFELMEGDFCLQPRPDLGAGGDDAICIPYCASQRCEDFPC